MDIIPKIRDLVFRIAYDLSGVRVSSRLTDAQKKYSELLSPDVVAKLAKSDPSGNHKYLDWMCKQALENSPDIIIRAIGMFHSYPDLMKIRDINKLESPDQIYFMYDESLVLRRKRLKLHPHSDIIYPTNPEESSRIVVVSVPTHDIMCQYGRGTKWCVASTEPEAWDDHVGLGGTFYLMFDLLENDKYAIEVTSDESLESGRILPLGVWEPGDTTIPHGSLRDITGDKFYEIFSAIARYDKTFKPAMTQDYSYGDELPPRDDLENSLNSLRQEEESIDPNMSNSDLISLLTTDFTSLTPDKLRQAKIILNNLPVSTLEAIFPERKSFYYELLPDFYSRLSNSFLMSKSDEFTREDLAYLVRRLPPKFILTRTDLDDFGALGYLKGKVPKEQFKKYLMDALIENGSSNVAFYLREMGPEAIMELPVKHRLRFVIAEPDAIERNNFQNIYESVVEEMPIFAVVKEFCRAFDTDLNNLEQVIDGISELGEPYDDPKKLSVEIIRFFEDSIGTFLPLSVAGVEYLRKHSGLSDGALFEIFKEFYSKYEHKPDAYFVLASQMPYENLDVKDVLCLSSKEQIVKKMDSNEFMKLVRRIIELNIKFPFWNSFPKVSPSEILEALKVNPGYADANHQYFMRFLLTSSYPENVYQFFRLYNFSDRAWGVLFDTFGFTNYHESLVKVIVDLYENHSVAAPSEPSLQNIYRDSARSPETQRLIQEYRDVIPLFSDLRM